MKRFDWTLLAISFAKGRGLSPVQLQKVLFLLGKELPSTVESDFYDFEAYNYGPFDKSVYSDASFLSAQGLVTISDSGQGFKEYAPTPEGALYAAKLKGQASKESLDYLDNVVRWAQSLSFSALVRAIYAKYPEYRENSVFQS